MLTTIKMAIVIIEGVFVIIIIVIKMISVNGTDRNDYNDAWISMERQ